MGILVRPGTPKAQLIDALVDHLIVNCRIKERQQVVIWWALLHSYFDREDSGIPPQYRQHTIGVHNHWKRHGKALCDILQLKHRVTTINVARLIHVRHLNGVLDDRGREVGIGFGLSHGETPDFYKGRTAIWYHRALTVGGHEAVGFVSFPENSVMNHPLVKEGMEGGYRGVGTRAVNQVRRSDRAEFNGTYGEDDNFRSKAKFGSDVARVLTDQAPLFRRPPGDLPGPSSPSPQPEA